MPVAAPPGFTPHDPMHGCNCGTGPRPTMAPWQLEGQWRLRCSSLQGGLVPPGPGPGRACRGFRANLKVGLLCNDHWPRAVASRVQFEWAMELPSKANTGACRRARRRRGGTLPRPGDLGAGLGWPSEGHCRSPPPAAGYFAPSHGGTSKSAWGACAWPLPRRLRPQRPRRLRARDIGRRASSLAYAAPISRSLAIHNSREPHG